MKQKVKTNTKTVSTTKENAYRKKKPSQYAGIWKNTRDVSAMRKAVDRLRGSVISYKDPFKPIGLEDWEALK